MWWGPMRGAVLVVGMVGGADGLAPVWSQLPQLRATIEHLQVPDQVQSTVEQYLTGSVQVESNPWGYASVVAVSAVCTCAALLPVVTINGIKAVKARERLFEEIPQAAETPYPGGADSYSPEKADEFYRQRPLVVLTRVIGLLQSTLSFQLKLLLDWRLGNLEKNEKARAAELLNLVSDIGPTAIKLGQALSIRTDLIPEAYALELRKLQDAVPPFPDGQARKVMEKSFGRKLEDIFEEFEEECIASASIGQVYRATLKPGAYKASGDTPVRKVAVKVQRPGVLSEICLDLYLLRALAPIQTYLSNAINKRQTAPEDIETSIKLVDEWGRGFVNEVDYRAEAYNTVEFAKAMNARGLDAVVAPRVIDELSGSEVLVTEWIEGTRLDTSASPDVPRLAGMALNAYLTMLLDTGTLHCDPHPGNLLRTLDGKLCVLDWGMTLEVPNDLQLALLEFISHINTNNLDAVPMDFVNLGFTPPDQLERVRNSGITDGLSFMLRQLSAGGGAKKVQERVKQEFIERYGDVSDEELRKRARAEMVQRMEAQLQSEGVDVRGVSNVMEEMSRRNRELFTLPPWVLYTVRAFSTLEGIGLSVDEDYAILQECYPYLARRLFLDDSPGAQAALSQMLSGGQGQGLDIDKLVEMADGFTSYTVSTTKTSGDDIAVLDAPLLKNPAGRAAGIKTPTNGQAALALASSPELLSDSASSSSPKAPIVDEASLAAQRELAGVLLARNGSVAQKLVIDEATRLVDAVVRNSLATALDATGLADRPLAKQPAAAENDDPASTTPVGTAVKALRDLPAPARLGLLPLTAPLEAAAGIANVVSPLVKLDQDDRRALKTLQTLTNLAENTTGGGDDDALPFSTADLARFAPDGDLLKLASDPETLDTASALSRRFAATLLRRAAGRIEQTDDVHFLDNDLERSAAKSVASTLAETYRNAARALTPDL